ncbi:MAG: hypothetical protein CMJ75_21130 [Planctomycetaceae bacterium]|nr:hypothetical protein [Planctomycetaceae bacterium]
MAFELTSGRQPGPGQAAAGVGKLLRETVIETLCSIHPAANHAAYRQRAAANEMGRADDGDSRQQSAADSLVSR